MERAGSHHRPPATSLTQQVRDLLATRHVLALSSLRKELGVGWGTLYRALHALSVAGEVQVVRSGRRRLVYLCGAQPPDAERLALLDSEPARRIGRELQARPGPTMDELCERLGETPRVVYYHVARLIKAGLLSRSSPTRLRGLQATAELVRLLDEVEKDAQ